MSDFYIKMAHAEREQKGIKMELYNTCARLIEKGKTAGMQKKLDIFFANDRLTEDEYTKLCTQLDAKQKGAAEELAAQEEARKKAEAREKLPDAVAALQEDNKTLKKENEMLKQCLLEMSEIVYA